MNPFQRLHDAILDEIVIDWERGAVRVHLGVTDSEKRVLTAHGVTKLVMPREHPWGPSVWINKTEGPADANGSKVLKIEMQSGDVLEITARDFELLPWE